MAVSLNSIVAKLQRLENISEFKKRFSGWGIKEKAVGLAFLILYYAPILALVIAQWWFPLAALLVLCISINYQKKHDSENMNFQILWLLSRAGGLLNSLAALYTLTGWNGPLIYMAVLAVGAIVWVRSR